jgi:hypothetical protein
VTGLVDKHGNPLRAENKKEAPPILGEAFGIMNEPTLDIMNFPGGGAIGFDLNRLTLNDYRSMKDHYQVNNSLSVLTFMLHQMEWHIECENKKLIPFYEEQLYNVWSRLVRSMSQAFWSGYSPNVLQWENDVQGRRVVLDKVKDLRPESCTVNWKQVEGYAPPGRPKPKLKIYDGIKQAGSTYEIPVSNTYWYPLLMEENNYYGKKLLRSAFQPWFFSQLIHLFSNRYFERFGEPTPVGRAPYDDTIDINGKQVKGNVLMGSILQQFRNRSVVVLPNDKTIGSETNMDFDYSIEYLESQMRGADFERYMTRLDEEISLSLFTPILMMRTADVGSYNLGTQHTMVYQWMLNAIAGDWTFYINKYILRPLRDLNDPAGANGPLPRIKFVRLGKIKAELLQAVVTSMMQKGGIKPNVQELGELAGLTFEEVEELTGEPEEDPVEDPEGDEGGSGGDAGGDSPPAQTQPARQGAGRRANAHATGRDIASRITQQVRKAFATDTFGGTFTPSMGYRRRMEEALRADGLTNATSACADLYERMDGWLNKMIALGKDEFGEPDVFANLFSSTLSREIESLR